MAFLNLSSLKTYLKPIPCDTTGVCAALSTVIVDVVVHNKNSSRIAIVIMKKYRHLGEENLIAILEATKRYLQSHDFNCPGKYKTEKVLFGLFQVEKPTNLLDRVYDRMDGLVAELQVAKKKTQVIAASNSVVVKKAQPVKLGPSWVFMLLGLLPTTAAVKIAKPLLHPIQSPKFPGVSLFTNAAQNGLPKCSVYRDIYRDYHVFGNVPLADAKFIGIGEEHNTEKHHIMMANTVNALGHTDDVFLLEGMADNITTECNQLPEGKSFEKIKKGILCRGWEDAKFWDQYAKNKDKIDVGMSEVYQLRRQCAGWHKEFRRNLFDKNKLHQVVKKVVDKVCDLLEKYTELEGFKEEYQRIQKWHNAFLAIPPSKIRQLDAEFANFLDNIEKIKPIFAKATERNAYFMQSVKRHHAKRKSAKKNRVFGYAGANHFISSPDWKPKAEIDFGYRPEIKEALENIPHVILIPKVI